MGSIHTINRLSMGLVQESLIQSHVTETLSQESPLTRPVDYLCGELPSRHCQSYSNRLQVVKEGLYSKESTKRKLALRTLKNLIWDSPDKIYKEEPELIREACRMAREDPDKKVQIIAHSALSMYFYHRHLSGLLLETELSKRDSLINNIAEVFLHTFQDPDLEMRSLAHEDEVLEFLRVHPQFINRVYDILKDQIIHPKKERFLHDLDAFKRFNRREDEFTWSSEKIDQMLLEVYQVNPHEWVKKAIINEINSAEVLVEILMSNPEDEILEQVYVKLGKAILLMPKDEASELLDKAIYASSSSEDTIIVALEWKSQLGNRKAVYLEAVYHPNKEIKEWGVSPLINLIDYSNLHELRDVAKNYFNLDSISPIQLAIPKGSSYEVVSNPEDLGNDPKLFIMAFEIYSTIHDPNYKIFFKELDRLNDKKARPLVLNYKQKLAKDPKRKNDPAGKSHPNYEIISGSFLHANTHYYLSEKVMHEWGHFLMRICYPRMPGRLGYGHDQQHDHLYDHQVSLTNAWSEGLANTFQFIEEIRGDGSLTFDYLDDPQHQFSDYSLYHKRKNEHFIGAMLATFLVNAKGELDPVHFKAFVDTLSNGGKCNRTQFGFRQFVVDFVREHPEEREAFYGALDKYGMMGLVPKRFLDA